MRNFSFLVDFIGHIDLTVVAFTQKSISQYGIMTDPSNICRLLHDRALAINREGLVAEFSAELGLGGLILWRFTGVSSRFLFIDQVGHTQLLSLD